MAQTCAAVLCLLSGACDSSSTAPTPPSHANGAETGLDEELEEAAGEGALGSVASSTGTGSSTVSGCDRTDFDLGGKGLGAADAMAGDVANCHTQGHYFSRATPLGGACTTSPLAKVDCNDAGLTQLLTEIQKADWIRHLQTDFAGFVIDQCVACPVGNADPSCRNPQGAAQTGTKVYFAKLENDTITVNALVLPKILCEGAATGATAAPGTGTGTATATTL